MSARQWMIVADRDRGDEPRPQDIRDGDRYVLDGPYLADTGIVRIERPALDVAAETDHVLPAPAQVPPRLGGRWEYRVTGRDDVERAASSVIVGRDNAERILERDRQAFPGLILQRRWVSSWSATPALDDDGDVGAS